MKCGFGIGYGIGQKYQPIWVSVSDLKQNSGFGRTLPLWPPRPPIPPSPPGSAGPDPSTFGSGANTHSGNKHEIVAGHAMAICQAAGLSLCARAFLPELVNKL